MNRTIQDFINCKRLAVVGVSRSGRKFGNMALAELKARGYEAIPVHPSAREIGGELCYPSLAALRGRVDGVWVCVPPQQAAQVLREAADAGLRNVWLQQGAESPEVLALARELGLNFVHGKCVLMYASPVHSYHGWHRMFVKLVGQL
jgi:predicted CoA-binding protein